MLLLVATPVMAIVALAHRMLQVFAPSNILIGRVRASRPSLRCSAALAGFALMLVWIAHALSAAIWSGAPSWLNLLVLTLLWDAIKCIALAVQTAARRCSSRREAVSPGHRSFA